MYQIDTSKPIFRNPGCGFG